ncbi:MAG: hypothetical protein F6K10_42525 [Moorea sp. SIO2B7]|nr:hypothetical protein [Moorena sp. SIO2B7]
MTIDLTPLSLSVTNPVGFIPGNTVTVNYELQNLGTQSTDGYVVSFYLSPNILISTSDRRLLNTDGNNFEFKKSTINPNSSVTLSTTLTLPEINDVFWNGSGSYFLGIVKFY